MKATDLPSTVESDDGLKEMAAQVRGSFTTVEEMSRAFIREAILRGYFRHGEWLPQQQIASILGVSRMPIRESLRQLEAEGLVSYHPHRGVRVEALTAEQIAEIFELRALVEGHVLRLAMQNLSPEIVDDLAGLVDQMENHAESELWLDSRRQFYEQLYELADRPQSLKLIDRLRQQLGRYLLLHRVSESGHGALIDYLRIGDVDGAQSWLQRHLEAVSVELQRLVVAEADGPAA